jgi:nickel superoxide dismutase
MSNKSLSFLKKILPVEEAGAHCDIPCKIYDPSTAIIACLSLIRMVDLIEEFKDEKETMNWQNKMTRFIVEKERQGQIVKEQITIIWGDFFKQPQIEKYPEVHELTHTILMIASKCKQEVNKEASLSLLDKVNRFSEVFWGAKGIEIKKAKCPYPPELEVIYPVL